MTSKSLMCYWVMTPKSPTFFGAKCWEHSSCGKVRRLFFIADPRFRLGRTKPHLSQRYPMRPDRT